MSSRFEESPGVPFPPPLVFVVGFVAGWALHRVRPLPILADSGDVLEPIAAGLVLLWLPWTGWAMGTFWRAGTSLDPSRRAATLVTSGPYAYSRNPMYVGMTVLYLGLSLDANLLWPLLLLAPVLAVVQGIIVRREEAHLRARFGADYAAYRESVRRWL